MAIITTEGIVLRTVSFRNTSLIAHIFTKDTGKIRGLAKAILARNSKKGSRLNSFLQPLTLNRVVYYQRTRSELHTLTQCDLIDYFEPVRSDLKKIAAASYMAELVDKCTQAEDANRQVFGLLLESLRQLCSQKRPDAVLRIFDIKFLSLLGFMPQVRMCAHCGRGNLREAGFSPKAGGLLCKECAAAEAASGVVSKGAIASMLRICDNPVEEMKRFKLAEKVAEELSPVLREFIGMHVCDDLKSLEFIEKIRNP